MWEPMDEMASEAASVRRRELLYTRIGEGLSWGSDDPLFNLHSADDLTGFVVAAWQRMDCGTQEGV